MKVKALARGVYGKVRESGEEFDIVDDEHLGSWMEPVSADDKKRMSEKIAFFARHARKVAPPGTPATTAQLKEIPQPRPNAKEPASVAPTTPPMRSAFPEKSKG